MLRIAHPLSSESRFTPPVLTNEEDQILNHQLESPFYYLGSGGQCFVFASSDGTYVLKLLKFHRKKTPWWLSFIPLSQEKKETIKSQKEKKLLRMLTSILISHKYLKQETGILYPHVGQTNHLNRKVICFDKLGNKNMIDADTTAFILQKKGISTHAFLKELKKNNHLDHAKNALDDLIELMLKRSKLGLRDMDPSFADNLGLINGRASQLDLGSIALDPSQKESIMYERNLLAAARPFYQLLKTDYPELAGYFWDKCLTKISETKQRDTDLKAVACDQKETSPFQQDTLYQEKER